MPDKVAVPFPLLVKLTPLGNAPNSDNVATGAPKVVTMKLPGVPTVKMVVLLLEIWGAFGGPLTINTKFWAASGSAPFVAVNMNE